LVEVHVEQIDVATDVCNNSGHDTALPTNIVVSLGQVTSADNDARTAPTTEVFVGWTSEDVDCISYLQLQAGTICARLRMLCTGHTGLGCGFSHARDCNLPETCNVPANSWGQASFVERCSTLLDVHEKTWGSAKKSFMRAAASDGRHDVLDVEAFGYNDVVIDAERLCKSL
jgi:hypothetical protein